MNTITEFKVENYRSVIIEFQLINSGIELGLFDMLEKEYHDVKTIAEKLGLKCQTRNLIDFLDRLFVSGHLCREGLLETAKYKNSHQLFVRSNLITN